MVLKFVLKFILIKLSLIDIVANAVEWTGCFCNPQHGIIFFSIYTTICNTLFCDGIGKLLSYLTQTLKEVCNKKMIKWLFILNPGCRSWQILYSQTWMSPCKCDGHLCICHAHFYKLVEILINKFMSWYLHLLTKDSSNFPKILTKVVIPHLQCFVWNCVFFSV